METKSSSHNSQFTGPPATVGVRRRQFVKSMLAGGAAVHLSHLSVGAANTGGAIDTLGNPNRRRTVAYCLRQQIAQEEAQLPVPPHPTNGDETRYPTRFASFTKGFPHDELGEVVPSAYDTYLHALATGEPADFEQIPLGCSNGYKLVNPQSGLAYDLEGVDSHATYIPPAPAFGSSELNAEMIELYWMALTRDVPFSEYATNPLTVQAAADLTRLGNAFKGPKVNGVVTPQTLFRGVSPGSLLGPYTSQFRYLRVPFGENEVEQKMRTHLPDIDFLTQPDEWLPVQNGCFSSSTVQYDPTLRYIRNGRDAAFWTHMDTVHQGAFMAMLTILFPLMVGVEGGMIQAPLNPGNPYLNSANQTGFVTFGLVHVAALVPELLTRAMKAAWFQKWFVHRRLRPEEYAKRIHSTITGGKAYPVNAPELLQSPVLGKIYDKFGGYLLPQVFPEGAPLHPSYPSGHATAAGAGVTILKAFFDESFVMPNPLIPTTDGLSLVPYAGPDADQITLGGELNKLASNVAQSRNIGGVHYRSDAIEGLRLGEDVAISVLRDQRKTFTENFSGFSFTKFDGTRITV